MPTKPNGARTRLRFTLMRTKTKLEKPCKNTDRPVILFKFDKTKKDAYDSLANAKFRKKCTTTVTPRAGFFFDYHFSYPSTHPTTLFEIYRF